jgi:peptidoglycan hydrolase-like protein with peptidoglycan-binding domain
MAYQDAVVAQARLWVGYHEDPNNRNIFSSGLGRDPEKWCQDFVQFVSASAGYRQPIATAAVLEIGHWAKAQHGLWIKGPQATPGCQICFDHGNGGGAEPKPGKTHTGIYIGQGQTIEGNEGDKVTMMTHDLHARNIWGVINWPKYWQAHPEPFGAALHHFPSYPVIQRNSKGAVVKAFQRSINDVLGHKLDVDGDFGKHTKAACEQFQKVSHLHVTGVCGQQTWAALDIAIDKLRP